MLSTVLTTLAARTYTYSNSGDYYRSSSRMSDAESGAAIIFMLMIGLFFVAVAYVVSSLFYMMIFKKAGLKTSLAWIPLYNTWKFLELGGQQGWFILLSFIPFAGYAAVAVFQAIAAYNISLKLGKSGAFVILYIFFAPVWFLVIGLDDSVWNDSLGQASLAEGTILGYTTETEAETKEETK